MKLHPPRTSSALQRGSKLYMGTLCYTPNKELVLSERIGEELRNEKRAYSLQIRLLIIGLPNSGKTTFLQQLEWNIADPSIRKYTNWIQRVLVWLVEEFESLTTTSDDEHKSKYGPHL